MEEAEFNKSTFVILSFGWYKGESFTNCDGEN